MNGIPLVELVLSPLVNEERKEGEKGRREGGGETGSSERVGRREKGAQR